MSRFHGGVSFARTPEIQTSPSSASSRPATMRSVVVFPQPDGPSRQTNCPRSTVSDTRWTATNVPNRFVTSLSSRSRSVCSAPFDITGEGGPRQDYAMSQGVSAAWRASNAAMALS